jgi:hypothetical protein
MENTYLRTRMLFQGDRLAQFFNNASEQAGRGRILQLREYCLRLQKRLDEIIRAGRHINATPSGSDEPPTLWCVWGVDKEVGLLMRETDQLLARYSYSYRRSIRWALPLTAEGPPTVSAELRPIQHRKRLKVSIRRVISEGEAAELLLNLAEWGSMQRLLQCPNCRNWFMAGRTDQRFCSAKCTTQHHNRTRDPEEWAAKMRKYRKDKKEREQRQEKAWLKRGARHAQN